MANRLVSVTSAKNFIAGGTGISAEDEEILRSIIDGVSVTIESEILGYELVGELSNGLKQASATGLYGPEDYGRHRPTVLFLRRHLNISSITSIDNNGSTLAVDDFSLDTQVGAVRLLSGTFEDSTPRSVTVVYTAGYTETGSGDSRELSVPEDLKFACKQQIAHEWARRQPGGGGYGTTSITTPEGSLIFDNSSLLLPVRQKIKRYAKRSII